MKKTVWIPPLALFAGLAGMAAWLLRWRLLSTGEDHRGLLEAGHPLGILTWVLTAVVVLLVAGALWKHRRARFVLRPAPLTELARIPAMLMAAAALWGGSGMGRTVVLGKVAAIAAVLTAAAALVRCRLRKKQISPAVADIPALLFYMLCLFVRYPDWSGEPEVQRYAFSLLALVCLMFATYARSAVVLGVGKCGLFRGAGFLGVYFAFGAAADPVFTGVFLAMGLWLLLQLDTVTEEA